MRRLPLEQRVASRLHAAQLGLSVVRFSTGEEKYAPGYYAAPRWIAWLWRIVPRHWCWHVPGPERGGWLAPGIGGATWAIGFVRKSQCLDPPYHTYFVAWCNGREFTIPRRMSA